jgi:uncharacterized protein (TIGR00369 family)
MPTPNPEYVIRLQRLVREAPYPSHMGMELSSIDLDMAVVELTLGECHMQPFGIVHGGVLATLIDTATFWSAFLRLPDGDGLVNVDLKLNYLKAVEKGVLRAEGRCLRFGRSISYAESSVVDEAGELVAHGTSTLMALPGKGVRVGPDKFLREE